MDVFGIVTQAATKPPHQKARVDFWQTKFDRNVERDHENAVVLSATGWRVLIVWECETRNPEALKKRLQDAFLKPNDLIACCEIRRVARSAVA
jgi:G:T-mismatch repair DNA endonuclease (very short patch repair protein)